MHHPANHSPTNYNSVAVPPCQHINNLIPTKCKHHQLHGILLISLSLSTTTHFPSLPNSQMESKLFHLKPPLSHYKIPAIKTISNTTKLNQLNTYQHNKKHNLLVKQKLLTVLTNFNCHSSSPILPHCTSSNTNNLDHGEDLTPVPPSARTFAAFDMASLWVSLVIGVPSYYLAGSLVGLGMAWWQGIGIVFLANLIVLIPLILTAIPGTRYGIPFPVLARASFGVRGAHIATLLRALVGCGWYGIETWIGGEAIFLLLPSVFKNYFSAALVDVPWLGTSPMKFGCFLVFWAVQLSAIFGGMEGIRELEKYSAPILFVLTSALLGWAYVNAGGFGRMLSLSSRLSTAEFWGVFFPSLTANISFWATVALNIPDFTRYARSQKDQILGQIGLPVFMGAFTFVGLAVTSSTEVIFGRVISDPVHLLGQIGGLPVLLTAIFGLSLATITTNIAANVVAPANALVNLNPKWFDFRKGALLTALLGIAFQPWRLLSSSQSFVFTWLLGYSAIMGPIAGILLVDYYIVKRMELDVTALYSESDRGLYFYSSGFNVAAIVAMLMGVLPVVPGFLHKIGALSKTSEMFILAYNNAWFVSFFVGSLVYWVLCQTQRSLKDA